MTSPQLASPGFAAGAAATASAHHPRGIVFLAAAFLHTQVLVQRTDFCIFFLSQGNQPKRPRPLFCFLKKLSGMRMLTTLYLTKNDRRWVTFIFLKTINV